MHQKLATKMMGTLVLCLATSLPAFGKDLSSRLGIGFRDSFPFSLPSLAMNYYPNPDVGLVSSVGVDTEDQNSKFGLMIGVRKIIFKEDNLNFFAGGNLSILTSETAGTKKSGYELSGLVGTEFFLSGLENLGLNFETGVAVTNLDKVRFRTLGDHLFRAGMIFYF